MNNLKYDEAKYYLLRGHGVKLPQWQGYWKMNKEKNGVEVHTKEGEILDTPNILYTFHDNWEIATPINCPILDKEMKEMVQGSKPKEKNDKQDFKIINIGSISSPLGDTPVIVVKKGEDSPTMLTPQKFEELVGSRTRAMRLAKDFSLSRLPKELKEFGENMDKELEEFIDMVEVVEDIEIKNPLEKKIIDSVLGEILNSIL